jgi:hypothetical protein
VQEVHWTAGEYNYLVKARVSSTETLAQLMKKFGEIPGVRDSRTTLVLDTLKETQALSLQFIECKVPENQQNKTVLKFRSQEWTVWRWTRRSATAARNSLPASPAKPLPFSTRAGGPARSWTGP